MLFELHLFYLRIEWISSTKWIYFGEWLYEILLRSKLSKACTSTTLNHWYTCPTFNWTLFYACAVARAHRMSLHIFLKPIRISHSIVWEAVCGRAEVCNGKRNPRLIINGLNWSYSQTEQRNGNYLAGLLIASPNWMKYTFGSDYSTTHAHTHSGEKRLQMNWCSI